MPRFAANVSMMFTEVPFLDRFARARAAGFEAVEFLFPYEQPALFSMTLAFLVTIVVSKLDKSPSAAKERESFEDQNVRSQTGIGAAAAVSH